MRRFPLLALVLLLLAPAAAAAPHQSETRSLDTAAFVGWEEWPLLVPDDVALDADALSNLRIVFDGVFGPPGGGQPVTMYMDVFEHWFGARPTYWIQWTSSGNRVGGPEVLGIDSLVVDRTSFRILFRVAAAGPGIYELAHHDAAGIRRVTVNMQTGEAESHSREGDHPSFDFATFQFLFPFLDLQEGHRFRLRNIGQPPDLEPRDIAVRVAGRIRLDTAEGGEVEVWDVQVMPAHGRALIHFYVTEQSPYFWGWDYWLESGLLTTMRQAGATELPARTPPRERPVS